MTLDLTPEELADAWERVAENAGCAGVDDVEVEQFGARLETELARLLERVGSGNYRALPLRKIMVEKAPGRPQMRRLLVPAVRDRVLQTAVARRLSRSFEEEFLEASYAYRPGRGVDRAVARVQQLRDRGFEWVVDADIREFFDRVDHGRLLYRLAAEESCQGPVLPLLEDWVRAEFWDGHRVRRLRRGVPQGSPISPLLANFYLGEFDREVTQGGNHLVRYADDFLILCASEGAAQTALERAGAVLSGLELKLHPEKTRLTHFQEGFRFLGVFFFGNRAWVPWKDGARPEGKLLFCARRMPDALLARYERPEARSEMQEAFARLGERVHRIAPPNESGSTGRENVAYLYVTEQGSVVRKSGDRYLVESGDRVVLDLPYHKLEQVMLFGRVQVTSQAMTEMLDKGIGVSLFSRQGRYRGSLLPPKGSQVELRMRQFDLYRDEARCLELARRTVEAKVRNGRGVLERYAGRKAAPEGYGELRDRLDQATEKIPVASTMESLLGLEGSAAKACFSALMLFDGSGVEWEGRQRRPAPDPMNALLSLTYMLLLQEVSGALQAHGLDPYVGFLHKLENGRPSLALDLLEPFRHTAGDRLVLTLFNRAVVGKSDFVSAGAAGVMLSQEALKRFLGHYEQWMLHTGQGVAYRALVRQEAAHYVSMLRGATEWQPYDEEKHRKGRAECSTSSVTT